MNLRSFPYLLNNHHRSILPGNCMSVYPNQMYRVRCNRVNIAVHLDPLYHNPVLSILFCRYMYQPHNNHDPNMLDVDSQLFRFNFEKRRDIRFNSSSLSYFEPLKRQIKLDGFCSNACVCVHLFIQF